MRCPWCGNGNDKVVDSRLVEDGDVIRRRRECLACKRRYTTYERLAEAPLWVVKSSGVREPFDRTKIITGVKSASKNRPINDDQIEELALAVEETLRERGPEVESSRIGMTVLSSLQRLDGVAYIRFASVYKNFDGANDFQKELGILEKSATGRASKARGVKRVKPQ